MECLRANQVRPILGSDVFGKAVEDQLIILERLESVLLDRIGCALDPLASIAKGGNIIDP